MPAPPTGANGAQEVGHDGERADAHAAKRGGGGDVAVELLLQAGHGVAVALRYEAGGGGASRRGRVSSRSGEALREAGRCVGVALRYEAGVKEEGGRRHTRRALAGQAGGAHAGMRHAPAPAPQLLIVSLGLCPAAPAVPAAKHQHTQPRHSIQLTARKYCCSFSCLATSLALCPDTSIQVMENTAQTGEGGRR